MRHVTALAVFTLYCGAAFLPLSAAEPLSWERTPNRPAPAQFDVFHGESLDFRCTFTGFGALPFDGASDVRLWYQTNGMGAAWWSIPATVSSNALAATFTPDRDPGAERLAVFFGAPSNAYAAAQVRFRNSPGATPNDLQPPSVLDWQAELSAATNALAVSSAAAFMARSDAYTKEETDARIVELAPPGITTNDVCAIVTNEFPVGYTDWIITRNEEDVTAQVSQPAWNGAMWGVAAVYIAGDPSRVDSQSLSGVWSKDSLLMSWRKSNGAQYVATRQIVTRNALGLARSSDITNAITKAYVEGLGIEAGISAATATNIAESVAEAATEGMLTAETDPHWTAEKDEYAKTGTVAQVSSTVGALWSYVYGESVWIAVTNYMRTIEGVAPSFQLWEVRDGITNCVYSSAEEIDTRTHDKIETCKSSMSNMVEALRAEMPAKSWSRYQSATGAENPQPDKITIVSTPAIQMTGGGEWYEYISTGGSSIWVLRSNGLVKFGGNTNGFFRVEDDEGRAQFEVINTADVTVDAIAEATGFDADNNFMVTYNWTNSVPPTLYAARDLADPSIGEVNGEIDELGISVSWERGEGPDGMWTATVTQDERAPRLFVHAKVVQTGVRAVVNTAPARLDGGLIIGTTRYRLVPFSSGGKTYLTLEAVAQ